MTKRAHESLFIKLTGLVFFFVLMNSAIYVVLLQKLLGGYATYYPFAASTAGAILLASIFSWRSFDADRNSVARMVLCLSSALIVGVAVVFLSFLIILNTVGA